MGALKLADTAAGDRATKDITRSDTMDVDLVIHPARDHRREMHDRSFAPG